MFCVFLWSVLHYFTSQYDLFCQIGPTKWTFKRAFQSISYQFTSQGEEKEATDGEEVKKALCFLSQELSFFFFNT